MSKNNLVEKANLLEIIREKLFKRFKQTPLDKSDTF